MSLPVSTRSLPRRPAVPGSSGIAPLGSAASIYGGAGGSGTRVSGTRLTSSGGGSGVGFGGAVTFWGSGMVGNEKETLRDLNDRLAAYLEKVRSLEQDNRRLEAQIREAVAKKGPGTQDWGHHWELVRELRDKIFEATVENARRVLQIDNARLAADDFRVKYEAELAIRLAVENDISGLRKVIDDTNMARLRLEGDVEALREQLGFTQKNHEEEVRSLRAQVSSSGVTVEVDAPKSQDLGKAMAEIRAQYDALARKNLEELEKHWGQQITESAVELTQSSRDVEAARSTALDLRRSLQTLEIDLESLRNQKGGLEANLAEVETRYGGQLEQLRGLILRTQEELGGLRDELGRQAGEQQALRRVTGQLESEIQTYRRLLEGGEEFSLQDALEKQTSSPPPSSTPRLGGGPAGAEVTVRTH
ncbi:LOW QUALITY PROTEIN: keratin, type I cytoskeletal 18 [Accipiter gentilis]|uniref:LOW QUALITY PROTEIN: keratin, type I cytoskeletal 18 n=1 Tax=Astur gentilis TaxID=8957 RepID=UPI00210F6411|nr:LOW QUALITY PROTEIN: keratin, type I cytoskeletal 18 [Accipiter gentilis]